nr:MAG TPA: PAP2-like 2 protein [Caudoviricetes sp.]
MYFCCVQIARREYQKVCSSIHELKPHYPTDVLTGLVLGIIVGFIAWKLARVGWNWWINRNNDVEYEPYTFKRK